MPCCTRGLPLPRARPRGRTHASRPPPISRRSRRVAILPLRVLPLVLRQERAASASPQAALPPHPPHRPASIPSVPSTGAGGHRGQPMWDLRPPKGTRQAGWARTPPQQPPPTPPLQLPPLQPPPIPPMQPPPLQPPPTRTGMSFGRRRRGCRLRFAPRHPPRRKRLSSWGRRRPCLMLGGRSCPALCRRLKRPPGCMRRLGQPGRRASRAARSSLLRQPPTVIRRGCRWSDWPGCGRQCAAVVCRASATIYRPPPLCSRSRRPRCRRRRLW
mmetsp:Transcript_49943/g.161824  ORF Transcript_49943/g.161824 Transcript_49943/m.161824 type:complete len:272 (-) Transcript_49943:156-971(-)